MGRWVWAAAVLLASCECGLQVVPESSCADGVKNGSESGIDCGGTCPACALNIACQVDADCVTGRCTDGHCSAAVVVCADGKKGENESDVDCGGADCPACAPGRACRANADCASRSCGAGFICVAASGSCSDGAQNTDESDVDCGGATCSRCMNGARCGAVGDCLSGVCLSGRCQAPATCTDGQRNGEESDVDCGGSACARCTAGAGCSIDGDCLDRRCVAGRCSAPPSCDDHVRNGDESDVDCGGSRCARCNDGLQCDTGTDCQSTSCVMSRCAPQPTCSDGRRNADEADVDCGGARCARCMTGALCNDMTDCLSNSCVSSHCTGPASCNDQQHNGGETDVDCGGPLCVRCQVGATCSSASDCFTGLCSSGHCTAPPSCSDAIRNGNEADVDCGGPVCSACSVGKRCAVNSDCASTNCSTTLLTSDTSWRFTVNPPQGWEAVGFNDTGWSTAASEGAHGSGPPWGASPPLPEGSNALWIWSFDTRNGFDSSTLSFRKTFVAPPSPVEFHIAVDDNFTAKVNGVALTTGSVWFTPGVATVTIPPGTPSVLTVTAVNNAGAGGLAAHARLSQPVCAP